MQVLKQRFARKVLRDWRKRSERGQNRLWEDALNEGHVWQRRFEGVSLIGDQGVQSTFQLLRIAHQMLSAERYVFCYGHAPRPSTLLRRICDIDPLGGTAVRSSTRRDRIDYGQL